MLRADNFFCQPCFHLLFLIVGFQKFPAQIESVIHRSRALPKVKHRRKRARDIVLGSLNGDFKVISFSKV